MPQRTSSITVLSKNIIIEFKTTDAVYAVFCDWLRNARIRGDDWLYLLPVDRKADTVIGKIVVPAGKADYFCLKLGYFCDAEGFNFDYKKRGKAATR